jgi:hypothetical protein
VLREGEKRKELRERSTQEGERTRIRGSEKREVRSENEERGGTQVLTYSSTQEWDLARRRGSEEREARMGNGEVLKYSRTQVLKNGIWHDVGEARMRNEEELTYSST